jgi:hypothetical protein
MAFPRRAMLDDLGRMLGLLGRGDRSDIREVRRLAYRLKVTLERRRQPDPEDDEQLAIALRFLHAAECVEDCPLGIAPRALTCVARQIASEAEVGAGPAVERTKRDPRYGSQAKRGRLATFVQCRTELCPVGAAVRARLGDTPEAQEMARHAPRCSDTASN